MKNSLVKIPLETKKQFEILDITSQVKSAVGSAGLKNGLVNVYCPHTTASIRVNHNEPLLLQDIMKTMYRLAPVDISYSHDLFELRQNVVANERSNGHAHIKAFLLGCSETLPVENGEIALGGKQSIFFVEFDGGRHREIFLKFVGD